MLQWSSCTTTLASYVSVNSKPDHPPGDPRGFARSHCPRGRIFAQLPLPGGGGWAFELEKFSAVLKEKSKNFSNCFKETRGSLKSKCSCAVSYQFLQKQYMSAVYVITQTIFGHFGHFDKISWSSKGHFCQC